MSSADEIVNKTHVARFAQVAQTLGAGRVGSIARRWRSALVNGERDLGARLSLDEVKTGVDLAQNAVGKAGADGGDKLLVLLQHLASSDGMPGRRGRRRRGLRRLAALLAARDGGPGAVVRVAGTASADRPAAIALLRVRRGFALVMGRTSATFTTHYAGTVFMKQTWQRGTHPARLTLTFLVRQLLQATEIRLRFRIGWAGRTGECDMAVRLIRESCGWQRGNAMGLSG